MRIILPPAPRERMGSRVADRGNDDWLASHTGSSLTPRVAVAELEEAYRRVVMLRSAIVYPVTDDPPGRRWFVCRDPDGNPWEVVDGGPPPCETDGAETRILREWTGVATRSHAASYVAHLLEKTFPRLRAIPGCLDARIVQRIVDEGTEFRIVTEWDSMEAIREFAGPQPEVAVVPAEVEEMMVSFDRRVRHSEVVKDGLWLR